MKIFNNNFEDLLCLGKRVLNLHYDDIQQLFFGEEMCLYRYKNKNYDGRGIEIAIDNAILVCIFDTEVCDKSILYFNNLNKIAEYIRFCDSMFDYKKEFDMWHTPTSYLSLEYPDEYDRRFAFVQELK